MQIEASSLSHLPLPAAAGRGGVQGLPASALRVGVRSAQPQDASVDLKIGQLLCARLCHDLIGPAAAINAGEELIREGADTGEGGDARELIAESARQLAGRLTFFRIAFGQGNAIGAGMSYSETRTLAEGFLFGGRTRLDWQPNAGDLFGDGALSGDSVRLLLCLIMLAADALPRGGRVSIQVEDEGGQARLSLTAEGTIARLAPDLLQALEVTEVAAVTPRTVHAYYLSCLAARLHVALELDASRLGSVRLSAIVPPDFVERRRR